MLLTIGANFIQASWCMQRPCEHASIVFSHVSIIEKPACNPMAISTPTSPPPQSTRHLTHQHNHKSHSHHHSTNSHTHPSNPTSIGLVMAHRCLCTRSTGVSGRSTICGKTRHADASGAVVIASGRVISGDHVGSENAIGCSGGWDWCSRGWDRRSRCGYGWRICWGGWAGRCGYGWSICWGFRAGRSGCGGEVASDSELRGVVRFAIWAVSCCKLPNAGRQATHPDCVIERTY